MESSIVQEFLIYWLPLILQNLGYRIIKDSNNFTHPDRPFYQQFNIEAKNPAQKDKIKVASFNIKVSEKIDEAIEQFGEDNLRNADIILLQEMDSWGVRKIADTLEYKYIYYPACIKNYKEFGNAILTKWSIKNPKKIILPNLDLPKKCQRIATAATIVINNIEIGVYSVHLGTTITTGQRKDQVDTIIDAIDSAGIKRCIVGGDFNTYSDANLNAVLAPLETAGFHHASRHIDWTFKYKIFFIPVKKSTLDHIFTRGMKTPLNYGIALNNQNASDHMPVWIELEL